MASNKILNLTQDSFDSAINLQGKPVLVDFWAPWCGPCRAIAPMLDELAEEMGESVRICKVDVDTNGEIAGRYSVRAIPTLLIFKDGKLVDQIVGLTGKPELKSRLESHS